jgi:hypothetical protein
MVEIVLVFMRWLRVAAAAALAGGLLYGRVVCPPAPGSASRFRSVALWAIAASLVSGLHNVMIMPGHSPRYHMLLGIKVLLALHLYAVALMLGTGKAKNPARAMTGAAISGFAIIAIAAYLRRIF